MSLGWPFQKLSVKFWSVHKHGSGEWGLLALYGHEEILKNFLLWNCLSDFEIISQECSLGDPFQKLFAKFDPSINMGLVNGGFLHYTDMKKYLKNLLRRNRWSDFEIISQECSLGDPFQKLFVKFDPSINMGLVNGGLLHDTDMKKFLKNLLRRNRWLDFEIISQECSLGDPFLKVFTKFWSILNSLPNDILYWSKMKAFADDKINVT